jgi:hypothetical protein
LEPSFIFHRNGPAVVGILHTHSHIGLELGAQRGFDAFHQLSTWASRRGIFENNTTRGNKKVTTNIGAIEPSVIDHGVANFFLLEPDG